MYSVITDIPTDRHVTFQQQYRMCGKRRNCYTCRMGHGHGPYWYCYYQQEGKLHCVYVGKMLPEGALLPSEYKRREGEP